MVRKTCEIGETDKGPSSFGRNRFALASGSTYTPPLRHVIASKNTELPIIDTHTMHSHFSRYT